MRKKFKGLLKNKTIKHGWTPKRAIWNGAKKFL